MDYIYDHPLFALNLIGFMWLTFLIVVGLRHSVYTKRQEITHTRNMLRTHVLDVEGMLLQEIEFLRKLSPQIAAIKESKYVQGVKQLVEPFRRLHDELGEELK